MLQSAKWADLRLSSPAPSMLIGAAVGRLLVTSAQIEKQLPVARVSQAAGIWVGEHIGTTLLGALQVNLSWIVQRLCFELHLFCVIC